MIARRRMAGRRVARAAVGTAVVAGTAGAVRHHQDQRYARKDAEEQAQYEAQQEQYAPPPQSQYAPPPAQPAPPAEEDPITQIERLGSLKEQGLITEEEFAAQKAKILGT
jgi:hypothetical protein